jgi:dihydropteroate synthase-like protein
LAVQAGFDYSVAVLPITVASLATVDWIGRHLTVPAGVKRVMLPGLCLGDLAALESSLGIMVERGPKDLLDLPEHFGQGNKRAADYGRFNIEIIAEINHAPRLSPAALMVEARRLRAQGADVIDLGCVPGETWHGIKGAVADLCAEGMRVSIDTFNVVEAAAGASAGAELILSVNAANRAAAVDWGREVVAVPDVPADLGSLEATIATLHKAGIPFRIDPIIEPIGFGFAASLGRYIEARRRWPENEIMMGIGNLTELTGVDSAGVNVVLLGFCQELGVRSVLTTEVINWCRSCVRELDLARRLVYHAVTRRVLPKRLEPDLLMLRDAKLREYGEQALQELASKITDRNYRLFAERGVLLALNGHGILQADDPFVLFHAVLQRDQVDPSHAFYLGYELAKAVTALTLGKNYVQDQELSWGMLTRPEDTQQHSSDAVVQ